MARASWKAWNQMNETVCKLTFTGFIITLAIMLIYSYSYSIGLIIKKFRILMVKIQYWWWCLNLGGVQSDAQLFSVVRKSRNSTRKGKREIGLRSFFPSFSTTQISVSIIILKKNDATCSMAWSQMDSPPSNAISEGVDELVPCSGWLPVLAVSAAGGESWSF